MRIGIDCDGVLRDFIGSVQDTIKKYHPELADQLKTPTDWDWETWIPFWTEEETEKFVFEDHVEEIFYTADAYDEALEDWPVLMEWAKNHGHELVLVSAQRPHCEEPTTAWLKKYGFDFEEIHYTKNKWGVDVDVLIDDSPEKLNDFRYKSISGGVPICYKQTWNQECHNDYISIDRLSEIMTKVF